MSQAKKANGQSLLLNYSLAGNKIFSPMERAKFLNELLGVNLEI